MFRTLTRLLATAAATALAAGCSSLFNGPEQALTVAEEHPITVDTQVVTLTLDVGANGGELSALDKARVRAFANAYLSGGHGPVTVTAPAGSGDDLAVQHAAAAVRKHLDAAGVGEASVSEAAYGDGGAARQVILSYTHYIATPSACGDWSGTTARDYRNLRSPNFGCATQNNYAAMIADPRDLIEPADAASADATGRVRVIEAYRDGAITSSATDTEISAEVSN